MLRPKRIASQKAKQKEVKEKSENELDLSEESDDGDFSSASSDEYDPTKSKGNDETFESEEEASDSDEEDDPESSPEKSKLSQRKSRENRSRSIVSTLRGTHANKFKRKSGNNLQEILQRSQFQKKKSIFNETVGEAKEKAPDFDCSGGFRLSDSSGSENEEENLGEKPTTSSAHINQSSSGTMVDLKSVHENYQKMENAKAQLSKYKKVNNDSQKESLNIADLLAMGEGSSASTAKKSRREQKEDSDSDGWEEVEDDGPGSYKIPKQGVEITLNNHNERNHKKQEKKVDLEAQMKRKLNRNRKDFQLVLHKVNLLTWVASGNFVNCEINNTNLMANAIKLLPKNKNHCYPTDQTDVDYFKQITNWFKSTIKLNNKDMYCTLQKRPPLKTSLALQMSFKTAICRRDYVLIFVILLRAIGIQCRIVQSINCAPIMPPKSDLLSLSKKPEKKSDSKSKSSSHSSKNKKKGLKIAQLDGGDDLPRGIRNKIKIKALPGYKVEESFVNLNKDDSINTTKEEESSSRSKRGDTKMAASVEFPLDSPNRHSRSPSDKLFKENKSKSSIKAHASKETVKPFLPRKTRSKGPNEGVKEPANDSKSKSTLKVFSPRRLRSRSRSNEQEISKNHSPATSSSACKETAKSYSPRKTRSKGPNEGVKEPKNDSKSKNILEVFSPRRLRSRSRSNEQVISKTHSPSTSSSAKPNLKKLDKRNDRKRIAEEDKKVLDPKKSKLTGQKRKLHSDVPGDEKRAKINDDSDDSAKCFKNTSKKIVKESTTPVIDRRVLSSDDEIDADVLQPSKKKHGIDIWVEVYSEKDEKWLSIDIFKNKVDCISEITKSVTQPMIYVFAWSNDNSLKDVSARYCPNLNTVTRKLRVDSKYLQSVIGQFAGQKTVRDVKEDDQLNRLQLQIPMPTSIGQFKNHPLYALQRHLLKYEAIYPPEPPILGYIREEAIYPRESVFVLHTRETWLKEAKVVKLNEVPYKVGKTLKWDNTTKKLLKDIPQELFGIWQTKDFEPPVAKDGLVPRNAYGNVELFKPCMLPKGTVHLQLPGLNKVCKKIGVDCSQAITGFDSNGGWPYPVYDGFIICEEFQEKVLDAWNREQEEIARKETEKYEKRVFGNWKKLLKGLLIRERLKRKYNFEGDNE